MEVDVVSCETRVWIVLGGLGYLLIRVMDNPDAGHARIENIMGFIRGFHMACGTRLELARIYR